MASAARFEKPVPNDGTDKKTIKKTDIIVTGNAKEKIFKVGADRVITPIETLDKCKEYKNKGYVIMAERMGKKVKGFDYGNSPSKILKKEL